ncbi:MAG: single-stranded DNA-binding protein [Chloroflexi bacterium]|nr:single-stranded DNA-binding protein [Chloroflexota bacterium]
MAGYQYTIIVGNVGRDPELRYTQSGVAVCDFSVAVSRRWTDRNTNEQREETTWFKISAWRGLGETCNQYVHKGMQIMVTGRVSADAYLGQDGQPRASLNLTALDVQFLGRRGERMDVQDDYPTEPEDLPF